jgi:hypothetical protein
MEKYKQMAAESVREIDKEVELARDLPSQMTYEVTQEQKPITKQGRTLLEDYVKEVGELRDTTLEIIDGECEKNNGAYSREPKFRKESERISMKTGFVQPSVEVVIEYSGVPRKRFLDYFFRRERSVSLKVKLFEGIDNREFFPLEIGVEDSEKHYSPTDIASYLKGVVDAAVHRDTKLAVEEPEIPEMDNSFEGNLVISVADLFGDIRILTEYRKIREKEDLSGKLTAHEEKYTAQIREVSKGVLVEGERIGEQIGVLEGKIRETSSEVSEEIEAYGNSEKAKMRGLTESLEIRLSRYEGDRKKGIDNKLDRQFGTRKKKLEKELRGLNGEVNAKREELGRYSGNFSERHYYSTSLEGIFPDYDKKKGDEEDVTPQVRAEFAVRLSRIKTGIKPELVSEFLRKLSRKVKASSPSNQKHTKSDIGKMVNFAEWLFPRIPDNQTLKEVQRDILRSKSRNCNKIRKRIETLMDN